MKRFYAFGGFGRARYPVRYDAAHPDDARIVTFTDFWLFPLATLVVAGVCLAIAVDDWRHPSG